MFEPKPNEVINWPESEDLIVLTQCGKYLGTGYILGGDDYLTIDPGDGYTWQASLDHVTHVLNISDPCQPSSYFRCEWKENKDGYPRKAL